MNREYLGKKGKIFVISAPSGAGKTTILKEVLSEYPGLVLSISATTRPPRPNEVHGKDYFFLSVEQFLSRVNNHDFIEWEKFYDYYYGTLKSFVNDTLDLGKSIIFEVDVKGALSIKNVFPSANLIFIDPPSVEELKRRLAARNTECEADFKKRIERAELELSFKNKFDYVVVNSEIETAVKNVKKIIKNVLEDK